MQSCGGYGPGRRQSPTIEPSGARILSGDTIRVTVHWSRLAVWSAENSAVRFVGPDGSLVDTVKRATEVIVKGVSRGRSLVSVRDTTGDSLSILFVVADSADIKTIRLKKLSAGSDSMPPWGKLSFDATLLDAAGTDYDGPVEWSVSDSTILALTPVESNEPFARRKRYVEARGQGTAEVRVRFLNVVSIYRLTVKTTGP